MSKPRKILAIKLADLGDALMISPALRALRNAYPDAQLDVLTTRGGPVLANSPYIDRVIYFDKYLFDVPREALKPANLFKALRFLLSIVFTRYDTVILFHHLTTRWGALKYASVTLATLAPQRVGLDNGRGWFLNRKVRDRGFDAASERQYWLELAGALGAKPVDGDGPELFLSESDRAKAGQLYEEVRGSGPLVAIHPGGGDYSLARRWLPSGFARVADLLAEKGGARFVLVGGPEEAGLCAEVIRLMKKPERAMNLAGKTGVGEITAFLGQCDLFIGNDAGLMHLAAVAGTPVVAIFGPTNPVAWAPYAETKPGGTGSIIVQAELELPCRPCLYRGLELGKRWGCPPRPCLTEIKPEQVAEAAFRLINHET